MLKAAQQVQFVQDLNNYESLLMHKVIKTDTYPSEYLMLYNCNFIAVQLKIKPKTGVQGIGDDLYCQHTEQGLYEKTVKSFRL